MKCIRLLPLSAAARSDRPAALVGIAKESLSFWVATTHSIRVTLSNTPD
jgi:hypothetical protein